MIEEDNRTDAKRNAQNKIIKKLEDGIRLTPVEKQKMDGIILNGTDFDNANLVEANMSYAKLTNVGIVSSDLSRTNWSNSKLHDVDFTDTVFDHANFRNSQLEDVMFTMTMLEEANFTDAHLKNVYFRDEIRVGTLLVPERRINYNFLTGTPFGVFSNTTFENIVISGADENDIDSLRSAFPPGTDIIFENVRRRNNNIAVQNEDDADDIALAFEIHKAFKKLNYARYHSILQKAVPNIDKKDWSIVNIQKILVAFIRSLFPESEKEVAVQKMKAILERFKNSEESAKPNVQKIVSDAVKFVEAQSDEFKRIYLSAFIKDCYHAYSDQQGQPYETAQGMSCVNGIVERFVWIIGDTVFTLCSDKDETCGGNETYSELMSVFGKNSIDLNKLAQEWSEWLDNQPPNFLQNKNKSERKKSFLDFVKNKKADQWEWIKGDVMKYADKDLDYVFESGQFGGKRRKSKMNKKNTRKVHRNRKNRRKTAKT